MEASCGREVRREERRMSTRHKIGPLGWFLLVWVSLVYFWGLLYMWGFSFGWEFLGAPLKKMCATQGCRLPLGPQLLLGLLPPSSVTFTMLVLLYGVLLWAGLSGKVWRRWQWLYFLLQGGLVIVVGLVLRQETVILSLFLALILEAVAILKRARPVALVASGYAALFLLSLPWTVGPWPLYSWVNFLGGTDYAALILFVVGFLVLYMQQMGAHAQLEAAHTKLETAHLQLQASAERIEALTLITERQRLARELHDTLAQGVAGLIMQMEAANAELAHRRLAQVQDILRESMASARTTLADARGVIDELRTVASFDEFAERVHDEVRRFETATGLPCRVELPSLALVPADAYEPAFRTVREGLTNVARHAQAAGVWLRVAPDEEGRRIAVEVRDDGVGFEPAAMARTPGHYGLLGLRERARLAGGSLEVCSAPGVGTTIRLHLPAPLEGCPA
jgi:two-component system, NarL family, sensor histidine kinase YdfH